MAKPKDKGRTSLQDRMNSVLIGGGRNTSMFRQDLVAKPDAINETMRASGFGPKRMAQDKAMAEQLIQRAESQKRARTNYRRRKKAEQDRRRQQGQLVTEPSPNMMSDAAVDAAMAWERIEAEHRASTQHQLRQGTDWRKYSPEARRAMGYYTPEEREYAARLNDMRSSTVFGNVMPNFGRQFAYNNPAAEMDAFRGTAMYVPNAVVSGMGFGLPSATTATANGFRTGWQAARATGANLGQKTVSAASTAARQAAPIVTNPRWAATTAIAATPTTMDAADGSEQSGGFWNWVVDHPMESMFLGALAYKGGKGLWNKGVSKLRIPAEPTEGRPARFTEAVPERGASKWGYNPADRPPQMRGEPQLIDYKIITEQPSQPRPAAFAEIEPPKPAGLRPREKGKAAQWDAQNQAHREWEARKAQYDADNADLNRQWDKYEQAQHGPQSYDEARFQADYDKWSRTAQADYDAAMQRHQQDVADYNAEQYRLDQDYNTAMSEYNQRKKANEQAWEAYYESDPYKQWLERKNRVLNFRTGAWNGVKNNWYWVVPGGFMGYKWMTGGYSSADEQDGSTNKKNNTAPTDSTTTLPSGFRPIVGINDQNQVVVPNAAGRPDSIVDIEPLIRKRFGRGESGENQNQ